MSLLNDILDLSKIEAGQLDIALVPCDVRHKLGHVHQLFEPIANEKQIAFKFYVDPSVPTLLKIDPVRVRQCLSNLISNAMKFTHEGSVTTVITAERQGEDHHMVKIFVSDTGTGIPADKQDQIFLDFQQADGSTTRKYGGTGLGLSVTRSLARLMGGEITVSSQAGKGSIFILTFLAGNALADKNTDSEVADQIAAARGPLKSPAHQPSKAANAVDSAMANAPSPPPGQTQIRHATAQQPVRLNGMKVLMIDDNIVNRRVLRALLDEHEFEFTEAENGQIGLDVMAQTVFDLVLLDIHMPVLDGVETIKAIRQSEVLHLTPVIALTANAMTGDREKYISLGMDGYVSKPVNYDELMTEINRVLQERHMLRAAS
jgi:CheY-like chemotaxis protein